MDHRCHGRARPGHPGLSWSGASRTWMPGTRPGITGFASRFCRKLAIPARITKWYRQTKGRQPGCCRPRIRRVANSPLRRSGFREQLVDILPVDQMIDKRLQIVRAAIAIIDVVGMLPDVDAEDRRGAMDQRAFAIGRLG